MTRQQTENLEWTYCTVHGCPYWRKDFQGQGHVRIAKRNDLYVIEVAMVRDSDGWNRPCGFWMNETFTTLPEAEKAADDYFEGLPKYVGAVTGRL